MGKLKKNDKETFMIYGLIFALLVLISCLILFVPVGIYYFHRARTYVINSCLVLNADWEKFGITRSKYRGPEQCYEPRWYIRFQDETQGKTKISGKDYCVKESRENAVHELPAHYLQDYQIGRAYPCYDSLSNPLTTATFTPIDMDRGKRLLIIVCIITLVSLGIVIILFCKLCSCGSNKDDRAEPIELNTVAATTLDMEENAPLSPPQPYMKTIDA